MNFKQKVRPKLPKLFLLFVSLIFSVFIVFFFQLRAISNYHESKSREYFKNNHEFTGNCYINGAYLGDKSNDYRQDFALVVDDTLSLLPSRIRPFVQNNWAIVFTPKLPAFARRYALNVDLAASSAVTVPHIKTIFVFDIRREQIPYVLLHEFCHALADEYGGVDYDNEFVSLYKKYKSVYKESSPYAVPGYAASSQFEFFAATMSDFLVNPEHLRSLVPEIAEYMKSLLSEAPYDGLLEEMMTEIKETSRKCNFGYFSFHLAK